MGFTTRPVGGVVGSAVDVVDGWAGEEAVAVAVAVVECGGP